MNWDEQLATCHMGDDRRIQRAIEVGKKNEQSFTLVKNWCAHVRIERFGGIGMVEEATGLPIGHHGLVCDHAPAGGIMSWDIQEAAVEFYDLHCQNCSLRKPVGVPNLGSWVAERDTQVAKRQAAADAEAKKIATRLDKRRKDRTALRKGLPPVAADVIDQIEELDSQRTPELATRLAETARLAPEAFPPTVIEYAFGLLESREDWFDEAGLNILAKLTVDVSRLVRCAMVCLQHWSATQTAASVLMAHLSFADKTLIPAVLPALIRMASPPRVVFDSDVVPKIEPLARVNEAYPAQVITALDGLLDKEPAYVGLAACAIKVLVEQDPALGVRFARSLIAKLVRASWMPAPDDYGGETEDVVADLLNAVVAAFLQAPDAVDTLLQKFRAGASEAGEVRITSIYSRVLGAGRFRKARAIAAADRIAFRRLLWEAPKTTNEKVLDEIQRIISNRPYELIDLAREEIDNLLGVAIQMDERVMAFDAEPKPTNATTLDLLERGNQRQVLTSLRRSFVKWAAAGAAAAAKPSSYLEVMKGLPEDREEFAACMIQNSVALMETVVGLNAVLPSLYSALVGTSVMRRGSAAYAVGKMPWRQLENAPDLLLEAFVTTLTDPYVYVHRSAISALGRIDLPDKFNARARNAVLQILFVYENNLKRADIVLESIELLASRYLTPNERAGRAGTFCVNLLARLPAWRISSDIRFFARQFAHATGLMDLLVASLLAPDTTDYGAEHILEALADLPAEVIFAHRAKLAKIPVSDNRRDRYHLLEVIQILARSGAWAEAEQLSATAVTAIPETVREMSTRLTFELTHVAAAFEHALATSDRNSAATLAARWRELNALKEANDREADHRHDPLRNVRRTPGSV